MSFQISGVRLHLTQVTIWALLHGVLFTFLCTVVITVPVACLEVCEYVRVAYNEDTL